MSESMTPEKIASEGKHDIKVELRSQGNLESDVMPFSIAAEEIRRNKESNVNIKLPVS